MTTLVEQTGVEAAFAELLADVVRCEDVAADSHFFDDLGADSMVMAQFCARVRKRDDLPSVSIKQVYANPTIRSLAAALDGAAAAQPEPRREQLATPASTAQYVLCGALQLLLVLAYLYLAAVVAVRGYEWIAAGSGAAEVYGRTVVFGAAGLLFLCALPVAAKWTLVGRWKPGEIRIWSLGYVRFWVVKTLLRSSPLVLFAGSPLYTLWLRALGARIGRRAAIFS